MALSLVGCGRETSARKTQIIVAVSADAAVTARLQRIEARLFEPDAPAGAEPGRVQSFALVGLAPRTGRRVDLPFSFSIAQGKLASLRLELVGFDTQDEGAAPSIERKLRVRFVPGKAVMVSVILAAPCLDRAEECGAETTCNPGSNGAAECEPISEAEGTVVRPGRETFWDDTTMPAMREPSQPPSEEPAEEPPATPEPDAPEAVRLDAEVANERSDAGATNELLDASDAGDLEAPDASEPRDAGSQQNDAAEAEIVLDADTDASAPDAELEASVPRLPPEALPACPFEGVCPLEAVYPCVPSDDAKGYQCRGQYASWPMPDPQPGGKTPPRYTAAPELGVVQDENTGLLWQRETPAVFAGCTGNVEGVIGDSCTFAEALEYCSQLQLAGKRWRLPSRIELESLLDVTTNPLVGAMIDRVHFPDTEPDNYWSSSPALVIGSQPDAIFNVSFGTGLALGVQKSSAFHVRCVRSERTPNAPPSEHFVVGAKSVRDRFTKLEWLTQVSGEVDAEAAAAYCAASGYRVPTIKELLTLVNMAQKQSAMYFELTTRDVLVLWTSTPFALTGGTRVFLPTVGTTIDDSTAIEEGYAIKVRCVR